MIFNNEVDAYESWALFLIFVSILILITGVVLLTHKKPDNHAAHPAQTPIVETPMSPMSRKRRNKRGGIQLGDEEAGLTSSEPSGAVVWQVGDASDDEDGDDYTGYLSSQRQGLGEENGQGERQRILSANDVAEEDEGRRASTSSDATLARPDAAPDAEFGDWESAGKQPT